MIKNPIISPRIGLNFQTTFILILVKNDYDHILALKETEENHENEFKVFTSITDLETLTYDELRSTGNYR